MTGDDGVQGGSGAGLQFVPEIGQVQGHRDPRAAIAEIIHLPGSSASERTVDRTRDPLP